MESGLGTYVGNGGYVWLDVDEFIYCIINDSESTSPVANPCARITLLPEKIDVINCRRSQGCHKSDECSPCKNPLEKAITINKQQFLICGNNALNPRCHIFKHNGVDLPEEQKAKAFYLTKRWFPRTLTEITSGADVNSIRVLTLSLEPGPFLNKYSITGLEGENDKIQEVDKTRQELSLSRKKKYNPIKSFVFGDTDGIEKAFFLFSTEERLTENFPINCVASSTDPASTSSPALLKLRCCDPKFPYTDNHSCSYHATSFETAHSENSLFGIFRFPFALKSDERHGICKFSKYELTRVISTAQGNHEIELDGEFLANAIPGGLSKDNVIIGAKSQELLLHNRLLSTVQVLKIADNVASLSTSQHVNSQFAKHEGGIFNLEKGNEGPWHMAQVNLCPELPGTLNGRVEKCVWCQLQTAGYCQYASHKCAVSTRENRSCADVKNCQEDVRTRLVQRHWVEPATPYRKAVAIWPNLPEFEFDEVIWSIDGFKADEYLNRTEFSFWKNDKIEEVKVEFRRAGTVFNCQKYFIEEQIELITPPSTHSSTATTHATTTTSTTMESTTTTRKPETEKSSIIRSTQTTPLVTTTTATTQSTTTVTEPVSSSRSSSNSTDVHVNLTTPLALSSSTPGQLQFSSSSLLVLMLFIGIFLVGVVVLLSFLLYRLKHKNSYDLPEKTASDECHATSEHVPKTIDQTTQVTPSLPRKPKKPQRQGSSLSTFTVSPAKVSSIQERLKDENSLESNRRSEYTLSTSSTIDSTAPLLKH